MPTPLAVALSDFCRRAKSPASAAEVREALALVAPEDEFRVREVTDHEPAASPLGPFAVIDVLAGASPHLAAQRQALGYYELARTLSAERTSPPPRAPEPAPPAPPAAELKTAAKLRELLGPAEAKRDKPKDERPTIAERIAPKRRAPQPAEAPGEEGAAGAPEAEPAHPDRPAPRGRFTRIAAPKQPSSALLAPEAREGLSALVEQHPHRFALHRALSAQYGGKHGALAIEDVLLALGRHGLADVLTRKEREAVLAAFAEHRGAAGKAAWSLGLSAPELRSLIQALGIDAQVESLRDSYRREALAPKNLAHRLDLAARGKYLDDLGFRKQFTEHLARDLRAIFRSPAGGEDVVEEVARREGLNPTQLRRALERLGLSEELEVRDS